MNRAAPDTTRDPTIAGSTCALLIDNYMGVRIDIGNKEVPARYLHLIVQEIFAAIARTALKHDDIGSGLRQG